MGYYGEQKTLLKMSAQKLLKPFAICFVSMSMCFSEVNLKCYLKEILRPINFSEELHRKRIGCLRKELGVFSILTLKRVCPIQSVLTY